MYYSTYTLFGVTAVKIVLRCYCTALIHASTILFCALATVGTCTVVHHTCEVTFRAPAFFTKLGCIEIFVEITLLGLDDCFGTRTRFLRSSPHAHSYLAVHTCFSLCCPLLQTVFWQEAYSRCLRPRLVEADTDKEF